MKRGLDARTRRWLYSRMIGPAAFTGRYYRPRF
jgi:hypothetical protein